METLLENSDVSDIVTIGAEYSKEDNEILVFMTTPEISISLRFEEGEWDEFRTAVDEIDSSIEKVK